MPGFFISHHSHDEARTNISDIYRFYTNSIEAIYHSRSKYISKTKLNE